MKRAAIALLVLGAGALLAPGQDTPADTQALREEIRRLTEHLERRLATHARKPAADADRVVRRSYDVSDLTEPIADNVFDFRDLYATRYQPPEAAEPEEPQPRYAFDALIELVRRTCEPDSWDAIDGAEIEPRNGLLLVRTLPRVHARIERLLAYVRKSTDRRIAVEIRAVALEPEDAARIAAQPRSLDPAFAKALLGRGVRGSLSFAGYSTQGFAGRSGRMIRYVADFDVESAKGAQIGEPIPHEFFSGVSAVVRVCADETGQGALIEARLSATSAEEKFATLATRHGDVELPRVDVTRSFSTFWLPYGQPAIVGAGAVGGKPVGFVVTVNRIE